MVCWKIGDAFLLQVTCLFWYYFTNSTRKKKRLERFVLGMYLLLGFSQGVRMALLVPLRAQSWMPTTPPAPRCSI